MSSSGSGSSGGGSSGVMHSHDECVERERGRVPACSAARSAVCRVCSVIPAVQ
jgi:hypothetical protein